MAARLPAHLEVSALRRLVEGEGGFAAVLRKGEREAGTILAVLTENGANPRAYERMPTTEGSRKWALAKAQGVDNSAEFAEYLARRTAQDPDLWVIELDIADGERLIGLTM
jgi:hypothetical protein